MGAMFIVQRHATLRSAGSGVIVSADGRWLDPTIGSAAPSRWLYRTPTRLRTAVKTFGSDPVCALRMMASGTNMSGSTSIR